MNYSEAILEKNIIAVHHGKNTALLYNKTVYKLFSKMQFRKLLVAEKRINVLMFNGY